MSRKSPKPRASQSEQPLESVPEPEFVEPGNGEASEAAETETAVATEEPAQVELKIKGSDRSARAAAKRFGGEAAKALPIATPPNDPEPPEEDPIAALLSDGRNMVLVTRQKPRTIEGPDGREIATNVRIPGSYTCPTSKAEIEELVFEQHGGSKYKCTIHPDVSDGGNRILGHFTIENPDSKCPPYIDGVTVNLPEPEFQQIPTGGDPTMKETDNLVELKARLQRRLDRAETLKEIKQMEKLTKDAERELENDGKPPAPATPPGESEEIRKLREQNALLQDQLKEKKVNDRFDKIDSTIGDLTKAITALATPKPAAPAGEDPMMKYLMKKMDADSVQITELIKSLSAKQTAHTTSPQDDFDKLLDRFSKMKTAFGGKDSRVSELEDKLIDASMDRLLNGGEESGPADEEDAFKFALKQMTPVIKAYVEKKVGQREDDTGEAPNKEELKKIYEEAGKKAAQEIAEKWQKEGLVVRADGQPRLPAPGGKQVPPRHVKQGDRPGTVTGVQNTREGRVKTVQVEPHDLSGKTKTPAAAPAEAEEKREETMAKYTQLPGLGENGSVLKVEIPAQPGELRYDRKRSVDFVLDSIRSEILQGMPAKAMSNEDHESVVVGDALELLDSEILSEISVVENGEQLEKALGPWCDPTKIAAIKDAGNKDEATKSWLRRIFITISDNFKGYQRKGL